MSIALPNLFISGATGNWAHYINGIWDRSGELISGMPVYIQRGQPNQFLEYYAPNNQWIVRSLAHRNDNRGGYDAYVSCAAGLTLERCANIWGVIANGVFVDQLSVKVVRHGV